MNFKIRFLLLLTSCWLLTFFVFAEEGNNHYGLLFQQANQHYTNGEFEQASALYTEIANADYESGELYYNLGNSYFKIGMIPVAILYYEKAKKLSPSDKDIEFNLQLANRRITDNIDPLPEFFTTKIWNNLINATSVDNWGNWTIIFIFWGLLSVTLYLLSNSVFLRKIFFLVGVVSIAFSAISYFSAMEQESKLMAKSEAIVFTPTITVQSSPDENSTDLFVIHEGTKVKLLQEVNGWYKISLLDGNIGWLKRADVEVI